MRRAAIILALSLLAVGCGPAPRTAADLDNTQLSPALAQWLVGPVSHLATPDEIRLYLSLKDDAAASAFIDAFWAHRDPDPARPGNPVRELFEQRAAAADRRFSEAGYLGRRTDRGTILVLYGEPAKIAFEMSPHAGGEPVELWTYGAGVAAGLNHQPPDPTYRFVKHDDLTVLYKRPLSERSRLLPTAP